MLLKINKITFFWIIFYILIFFILINNSFNYLDPDLGWHLKVGEDIVKEKSVPNLEYYNYTLEGRTWVDHEWLSNVGMYEIYNNLGYIALSVFFALLIILILIILKNFTQNYIGDKKNGFLIIMFFQLFGVWACLPHFGVRVQEISLLFILLELIILYKYNISHNYKILFWLPLLFWFWASLHGSFLIGLFILFFWLDVKILEIILSKTKFSRYLDEKNFLNKPPHLDHGVLNPAARISAPKTQGVLRCGGKKSILIFLFFIFFSILITLFTPYGLKLYSFLNDYLTNTYYLTHISEWLPIYAYPFQYKQLIYEGMIATVLILIIYFTFQNKIQKKYKIDLWFFLLTIFFLFLAFKSKRNFPLLFIASFPFLIKFIFTEFNISSLKSLKASRKINIFIGIYLGFVIILTSCLLIINTNFTNNPFKPNGCYDYPCEAVEFLKKDKQNKNLNIFNSYGWGGFLTWSWPEKKLFIDGRLPQITFNNHTFLEEYNEFFEENKSENKLNEFDIKLILIAKDKKIKLNWIDKYIFFMNEEEVNSGKNNLLEFLNNSKDWQKIYENENSLLYKKQTNDY